MDVTALSRNTTSILHYNRIIELYVIDTIRQIGSSQDPTKKDICCLTMREGYELKRHSRQNVKFRISVYEVEPITAVQVLIDLRHSRAHKDVSVKYLKRNVVVYYLKITSALRTLILATLGVS